MTEANKPKTVEANTTIEVTPELVFQELRIAIGNDSSPLLATLAQMVSEAEQLNRRADHQIELIEASEFDDFTKVQLKSNWIKTKNLASAMIARAMLEAIHAAIAIQRANGNDGKVETLGKIMEKILNVKSKKIKIGG